MANVYVTGDGHDPEIRQRANELAGWLRSNGDRVSLSPTMTNPGWVEPFEKADALWVVVGGAAALVGVHFLCNWAIGALQRNGYTIQPAQIVRPDGSLVQGG